MQFTGKNLQLVRDALDLAIVGIDTEVGTCPNVQEFEDHLDDLESLKDDVLKIMARIDRKGRA